MSDFGINVETEPVMISGVYRSGTTFLAAMLGAHPQLKASSSTVKFLRFCLGRYGDMCSPENRAQLVSDSHARINKRWGLSLDKKFILNQAALATTPSYALMYDLIMQNMLGQDSEKPVRWVEKLAVQWEDIPLFLDMFPRGKAIHIYRDPRDVAASYKLMTFEAGNTFLDASFNFLGAAQCIERLLPNYPDRLMFLKAEDIAREPLQNAEKICRFLGLDYDSAMIDARKLHADGEDWASNTSFGGNYQTLPKTPPRWPENLTHAEVIFIEMIVQPYFSSLGYQSSGYFPSQSDWQKIFEYINEPFLCDRFRTWLAEGKGAQGYRTDPYKHEMKLVFPERFPEYQN